MYYFHQRRLKTIRRILGKPTTNSLVIAVALCRLDYCNSILAGLPRSAIAPLQRTAARLICRLDSNTFLQRAHSFSLSNRFLSLPTEYKRHYEITVNRLKLMGEWSSAYASHAAWNSHPPSIYYFTDYNSFK